MFHRLIPAAALAVLGLALPLFTSSTAQAGPPDRTLHVIQPVLDNSCMALIEWEPLQGGKPIYVNVILKYMTDDGYTTVLADGGSAYHRVKQNAGSLSVDFGSIAADLGAPSYQLEVNFVDMKDQAMSEIFKTTSDCNGA